MNGNGFYNLSTNSRNGTIVFPYKTDNTVIPNFTTIPVSGTIPNLELEPERPETISETVTELAVATERLRAAMNDVTEILVRAETLINSERK